MDRREFCLTAGAMLCISDVARANARFRILLLYPKYPRPARSEIDLVLSSFVSEARTLGLKVLKHELLPVTSPDGLLRLVHHIHPDVLAVIGGEIVDLAASLPLHMPVLATGAQLPVPDGTLAGISLVVDPTSTFSVLKKIAPSITRVSVVIDPRRFGWLKKAMQEAAERLSLELAIHETDTLGAAAAQYSVILERASSRSDSLWLLDQPEFLTPDVLPRVIEGAWGRKVVVFSNVLDHVSEGVLFGTYLDPKSLGRRFARLAALAEERPPPLLLDDDPAFAIDLRTARHLAGLLDMSALELFHLRLGAS